MIAFINGAFGVGKTTVADLVLAAYPGARIFDPETVGTLVMSRLPVGSKVEDFQDLPEWRRLVVEGARGMHEVSDRPLIIPMTVWRSDYLNELLLGLRGIDADLRSFCLTANVETLRTRIMGDPVEEDSRLWRLSHMDVCTHAFANAAGGRQVVTDGRTPFEVARVIIDGLAVPGGDSKTAQARPLDSP